MVTELTTVDESGAISLKKAIDLLEPAGATAIDYGLALADHALFDDRSETDIAGRHEIVVLFTDGSPTHGSGYSDSVAANADASQLSSDKTNMFCHYVSSNSPDAKATNNTINPGVGSPSAGYYWVPNNVLTLDAIFESILEQIGTPTIELGESAAVIDSLTPYFTLPNGTNTITLHTVAKNATGWDNPQDDDRLHRKL